MPTGVFLTFVSMILINALTVYLYLFFHLF